MNGRRFRRAGWREAKPGVIEQYRETVELNSQHLYVLADGTWIVTHTDDVNPDAGDVTAPAEHFFRDHPIGKGLLAAGVIAGVGVLVASIADALTARS